MLDTPKLKDMKREH